jgi:hypothetical protein
LQDFGNITFKRLKYDGDQWTLEMEVLSRISDSVLRPIVHSVTGAEAILFYHRRVEQPAMLAAAEQILGQPASNEQKLCFEPLAGSWVSVPEGLEDEEGQIQQQLEQQQGQAMLFEELRSQLARSLQAQAELETRVTQLEGKIAELAKQLAERPLAAAVAPAAGPPQMVQPSEGVDVPPLQVPGVTPGIDPQVSGPPIAGSDPIAPPAIAPDMAAQQAERAPFVVPAVDPARAFGGNAPEAAAARDPASTAQADASAAASTAAAVSPQTDAAAEETPPKETPPAAADSQSAESAADAEADANAVTHITRLPDIDEFSELLEMLVGEDCGFEEGDPSTLPLDKPPRKKKLYISEYLDDGGNLTAAAISDLEAMVNMGGTMMMLPEGALKEMLKKKSPSDEVLDAGSEIFNNLTSLINGHEENPHIRAKTAEPYDPAKHAWVATLALRQDYVADRIVGHYVIVTKPPA